MMTSLFSPFYSLTCTVIGSGRQALFADQQDGRKADLMIMERALPNMLPLMANYTHVSPVSTGF